MQTPQFTGCFINALWCHLAIFILQTRDVNSENKHGGDSAFRSCLIFISFLRFSGKDSGAGVDTMFSTTEIKSSTLAQTEPIYAGMYYTAGC